MKEITSAAISPPSYKPLDCSTETSSMSASTTRFDHCVVYLLMAFFSGLRQLDEVYLNKLCVLQIYEIPFFVALDHKREAVLVAVRGTLSLKVSSGTT